MRAEVTSGAMPPPPIRKSRKKVPPVPSLQAGGRPAPAAIGGGLEGAERLNRETALWQPSMRSPDAIIRGHKDQADARGRDSVRNMGYIHGAAAVHKDSVVGSHFRLMARPDVAFLATISKGFNEAWATDFQKVVEARFHLLAESPEAWLDASRMNTFTGMIRIAIAVFLATGETIATAEWVKENGRPYNTAMQFVRSDRLCNPYGVVDTRTLRRGVEMDQRGKPLAYNFRKGERFDYYPDEFAWTWVRVPARKPWGRKQVIHIIEQYDHGQSRGIADMTAVLKNLHMTKRFSDVTLQSAVINATYAAAIESELPSDVVTAALGKGDTPEIGMTGVYGAYLEMLGRYLGGANNIGIDGAVVPHLFPGTKMRVQNVGTPGGLGTGFEESMLRHIAAGIGVSYESLSRDFSKTNYSSGRLAMNLEAKAMASRKRHVADRFASEVYALVMEEMIANGDAPLPKGVKRDVFYQPLAKEALCRAQWIGSGQGQVDELKESQAAILRIRSGLTTHAIESARLGHDWREIAEQRKRELDDFTAKGLPVDYISQKPMDKPTDVPQDNPAANPDDGQEAEGQTDEEKGAGQGSQET